MALDREPLGELPQRVGIVAPAELGGHAKPPSAEVAVSVAEVSTEHRPAAANGGHGRPASARAEVQHEALVSGEDDLE